MNTKGGELFNRNWISPVKRKNRCLRFFSKMPKKKINTTNMISYTITAPRDWEIFSKDSVKIHWSQKIYDQEKEHPSATWYMNTWTGVGNIGVNWALICCLVNRLTKRSATGKQCFFLIIYSKHLTAQLQVAKN